MLFLIKAVFSLKICEKVTFFSLCLVSLSPKAAIFYGVHQNLVGRGEVDFPKLQYLGGGSIATHIPSTYVC